MPAGRRWRGYRTAEVRLPASRLARLSIERRELRRALRDALNCLDRRRLHFSAAEIERLQECRVLAAG